MKKLFLGFLVAWLGQAATQVTYSADVAISALPAASAIAGTEVLPVVQSATTKKATALQVGTYIRSTVTKTDVGLANVENTALSTWAGSTNLTTLGTVATGSIPYSLITGGPTIPTGANPTASAGLTAVNGSATSFLRSDGSPAIDQSIIPIWTGLHTFNAGAVSKLATAGSLAGFVVSSNQPVYGWSELDQSTDAKTWDELVNAGVWCLRTVNDANSAASNAICVTRSGNSASVIAFGNGTANTTYNFQGTGSATFNGNIVNSRALVSGGTKFTAVGTGCTVGTTVGGGTSGTFTLAAGPCTSVAVTLNGATGATAPTGWSCSAHDRTTAAALLYGESSSTATTATFTIPITAGTTDVISFSCVGF